MEEYEEEISESMRKVGTEGRVVKEGLAFDAITRWCKQVEPEALEKKICGSIADACPQMILSSTALFICPISGCTC